MFLKCSIRAVYSEPVIFLNITINNSFLLFFSPSYFDRYSEVRIFLKKKKEEWPFPLRLSRLLYQIFPVTILLNIISDARYTRSISRSTDNSPWSAIVIMYHLSISILRLFVSLFHPASNISSRNFGFLSYQKRNRLFIA